MPSDWVNGSMNHRQTYPAGRLRTAAFVAVVLIRRIGCPVTRLFQEYGSATRVPGFTTAGGLGSPAIEPRKFSPRFNLQLPTYFRVLSIIHGK